MRKMKKICLAMVAVMTMMTMFTACSSDSDSDSKTEDTNAGTQKDTDTEATGEVEKITVAHILTYKPYAFVNESGESDGYEVKVMMAIDELLEDYEFEYVQTSDEDLLIGLESGKYDVGVKGAWYTEERAEKFLFPEHYIGASSLGLVIRSDTASEITDMDSFAAYSGKLVPISPQSAQYSMITQYNDEHTDNQIILEASDTFDVAGAYQWVLEGRYDAYMDLKTTYEENVVAEDGVYHDLDDDLKYIVYKAIPTYPLFNKDNQEFVNAYNTAFNTLMENGTIEELENEYFGEDLFQYVEE